ncbi:MAG: Fic family protein [Thermodesulfobacteriota bacterium]|nr:Fic family protein [Thermodesulfobacteriota bacterium]
MIPNSKKINSIDLSRLDFQQDKKRFLFLAQKDKIDFIYNTAALEGNAMTYPDVATLLDGITVGGHKLSDEQQILNQNRSVELLYQQLREEQFVVDKHTLCLLHAQVAKDEALTWGVFRDGNVNIGGTEYLPPVPDKLDDLFIAGVSAINKIEHPIVAALTYFLFGARTQFFYDGNKRVSRLMMNGILLANGYPMLNIKTKDKLIFNQQMILFYDTADYVGALEYLRDYYIKHNNHIR